MFGIRILVEIPEGYVDFESPLGITMGNLKQKVQRILEQKIEDEYVKKMKFPKIEISEEEVKQEIIRQLARNAINRIQTPASQ